MKKYILLYLCLLALNTLSAQCPTKIHLENQKDIDQFKDDYPNCTDAHDLYIEGTDIISLEGLSSLKKLDGVLDIFADKLKTLEGLHITLANHSSIRLFGLSQLTEITSLTIPDTLNQVWLSSMHKLANIAFLTSLKDCQSLSLGWLNIKDLDALKSLRSVKFLDISYNDAIQSIALDKLESVYDIYLQSNKNLQQVNLFPKVQKMHRLAIKECKNTELFSGVDSLLEIDSIVIQNSPIKSLQPFQHLHSLKFLQVEKTNLMNLDGLEHVTSLDQFILLKNPNLADLDALSNLQAIKTLCKVISNPTLEYCNSICASISNTKTTIILDNAPSCDQHESFDCSAPIIQGSFFYDENKNKIKDDNEVGLANQLAWQSEFGFWQLTDSKGRFFLPAKIGKSYKIIPKINENKWILTTDSQSFTIQYDSLYNANQRFDFGLYPKEHKHEVKIFLLPSTENWFPGDLQVLVKNTGTFTEAGMVTIQYQPLLQFDGATPAADTIDTENRTITWNYSNLKPFSELVIDCSFPYEQISSSPRQKLTAKVFRKDVNEILDLDSFSFQFNFERISRKSPTLFGFPQGAGATHAISIDTTLTYCENTYNFPYSPWGSPRVCIANFDSKLDINTFEIIHSNTVIPPAIKLINGQLITSYSFFLPNGHSAPNFTFQIQPKPNLLDSTLIRASFFAPSLANTVFHTLVNTVPKPLLTGDENDELIFVPNPASNKIRVKTSADTHSYSKFLIINPYGRIVKEFRNFDVYEEKEYDISDLPNGIYYGLLTNNWWALRKDKKSKSGKLLIFHH